MKFEIIGDVRNVETIASGRGIRDLRILTKLFGAGNWRKIKGFATVRFANGQARCEKTMSSEKSDGNEKHFAVCVRNDDYEGALELRKIYEILEDMDAVPHDLVRVVDESGEDYLYPREWFLPIQLPQNIEEAIEQIALR